MMENYEAVKSILEQGKIAYTCVVKWTSFDGSVSRTSALADNFEGANASAWRMALATGWTHRKWWQFWRWNDTPNPANRFKAEKDGE